MKMLDSLARLAHRRRFWLLGAFVLLIAAAAAYGVGTHRVLHAGGFADPNSESSRAEEILKQHGLGEPDVVVAYSKPLHRMSDPPFAAALQKTLASLRARPEVARVDLLPSNDGRIVVVSLQLRGPYEALEPHLRSPDLTSAIGGVIPSTRQAQEAAKNDLERGELIALPLVALLLIIFFRGVVAASLPLMIGGFAIASALAMLRLLAHFTTVSIFALNIATFLGFGVAIDYALFMTTRFRDELGSGADVLTALRRTVNTSGRTVASSGLAVAASLLGILVIPIPLLRSVALSGTIVVVMAVTATLIFLPAALAALGPRINMLSFGASQSSRPIWGRIAHAVMRAPIPIAIVTTAILLMLGAPFLRMKESVAGASALPYDSEARQVAELLVSERFPKNVMTPVDVVIDDNAPAVEWTRTLSQLPHVMRAVPLDGSLRLIADVAADSDEASALVDRIRGLEIGGTRALVGGRTAALMDLRGSLSSRLPLALALISIATFVVLFGAFRSVVMPIKAIIMNVLSLTASFGALVFIFQDGRLEKLLDFRSPGSIELTIPIMMFSIVFGLAMDYELFLLSRIREAYLRTHDGRTSVATGLEQTGRIITRAALLVIAVMVGFMSADMLLIKELGVGMAIAIAVDATIVRALLVPATMELLGDWNWWSPRWLLALLYRRPAREY